MCQENVELIYISVVSSFLLSEMHLETTHMQIIIKSY